MDGCRGVWPGKCVLLYYIIYTHRSVRAPRSLSICVCSRRARASDTGVKDRAIDMAWEINIGAKLRWIRPSYILWGPGFVDCIDMSPICIYLSAICLPLSHIYISASNAITSTSLAIVSVSCFSSTIDR